MRHYDLSEKQLRIVMLYIRGDVTAGHSAKELNMARQSFTQLVCSVIPQLVREGKVKLQ